MCGHLAQHRLIGRNPALDFVAAACVSGRLLSHLGDRVDRFGEFVRKILLPLVRVGRSDYRVA
jgi:hypothetical protein